MKKNLFEFTINLKINSIPHNLKYVYLSYAKKKIQHISLLK